MKLIYVASPYAGDIEKNTEFAKKASRHAMEQGHSFFCPHLMYPNILNDNIPKERELAINMGLSAIQKCDEVWCYGEHISYGMHLEIQEAKKYGIPLRRVIEQENGFVIGNIKNISQTQTPALAMEIS